VGVQPPASFISIDHRGQSQKEGSAQYPLAANILSRFPNNTCQLLLSNRWAMPAFEPTAVTYPTYGGSAYPDVWPVGIRSAASSCTFFADMVCELMQPNPPIIANIQNAKSGLALRHQMPGSRVWQVAEERLAIAKAAGGVLDAVVFNGCQSDSETQMGARAVSARLVDWIGAYRLKHGNALLILWQVGDPPPNWQTRYPFWSTVTDQIEDAHSKIENCILLRSRGFATFDGVHWTTQSARRGGEMEGLAYFAAKNGAAV
jgi:hypothetical protein